MKKIALLLFAAAAFISVQAQTADDVINKYIEAMEENKKLYERLLQTEREKTALLEKMLDSIKDKA